MFNNTGIKSRTAGAPVQILFNVHNQMSVSIIVDKTAGVEENGRTIVKAGTPLGGDLANRKTAFTSDGDTVGVLLHDVDVTDGPNNGTLLIWGFVNLDRIDATTAAKITDAVKTALKGAIWFLKD